jgi:uncharacterized protein
MSTPAQNRPNDGKLRCPKDATLMEKIRVGQLEVEHCARCGAMWFDAYELANAVQSKRAVAEIDYGTAKSYDQQVHNAAPLECPRDHAHLVAIPDPRQPHVVIDVCRQCGGVLLDAGELKDLSELTLAERLRGFFKKTD